MRNEIKEKVARITIERIKKKEGDKYINRMYILLIKKGNIESGRGFLCSDEGFKEMMKKIEEELKK